MSTSEEAEVFPLSQAPNRCVTLRVLFHSTVATKGKIQIQVEYWLARALLALFGALPLSLGMRFGACLARGGQLFPKLRRTAERNLTLVFPELPEVEQRRL